MLKKIVLGISGLSLTDEEITLFKKHQPFGIILFKRNCENEFQLKLLTASIKAILPESKIYIDQEGGRVARLKQPNFIEFPAANTLKTEEEVYKNYFSMGQYLHSLGIDINCAPVADLYYPYADNIIGDRSFGNDVDQVIKFASACAQGLIDAGIIPIIKHIPGHGRALVDSHHELPIVDTELAELEKTDFAVFKGLNHLPMAMTAHVIYTSLDEHIPVSISNKAINYIKKELGFRGIIISDDINMKALHGDLADLAKRTLDAGCDLALHCSGKIDEMTHILENI